MSRVILFLRGTPLKGRESSGKNDSSSAITSRVRLGSEKGNGGKKLVISMVNERPSPLHLWLHCFVAPRLELDVSGLLNTTIKNRYNRHTDYCNDATLYSCVQQHVEIPFVSKYFALNIVDGAMPCSMAAEILYL